MVKVPKRSLMAECVGWPALSIIPDSPGTQMAYGLKVNSVARFPPNNI